MHATCEYMIGIGGCKMRFNELKTPMAWYLFSNVRILFYSGETAVNPVLPSYT